MKQLFLVAVSVLLLASSCREIFARRIRGNGNITTQTRSAGQFNGIDVSGSIQVYVKQDSAASIRVEADENLQQYIETVDDGDVLRIRTQTGYNLNPSGKIKVYVSSTAFKSFEASGACDIFSDGRITNSSNTDIGMSGACGTTLDINSPRVSADVSGSCTLSLKGETKDFKIQGSGSTTLKCYDLVADNVDLDISGAGDVEVYANSKLTGSISGAADVHYKGAAQTDIHTSGASSVNKTN